MSDLLTGSQLREVREKMGLTQEQFCQYTDYTRQTINRIEKGVVPVNVQSEKVFLLAFSRWSGAYNYGVSITFEGKLRRGVQLLIAS
jgi:transcriptional regulator with XRE-family HTH domain